MVSANEKFVIDTCSILDVKRRLPAPFRKTVYGKLTEYVGQKVLYFPDEVFKELKNGTSAEASDQAFAWAKANREDATSYGDLTVDVAALLQSRPVVSKIIDPEKGAIIEADPYILALALKMKNEGFTAIVITEETKTSSVKMALSQACGILRIPSIGILTFLDQEGISTGL